MKKKFTRKMLVAMVLTSWMASPMQMATAEPVVEHLNNVSDQTISSQVFQDIDYTGDGGAIYNTANLTIIIKRNNQKAI